MSYTMFGAIVVIGLFLSYKGYSLQAPPTHVMTANGDKAKSATELLTAVLVVPADDSGHLEFHTINP
jgi:hypothetical protein